MSPGIALLATIGGCSFLLWRDSRRQPTPNAGLWLPTIWIVVIGSRFLTQWLGLFGLPGGGALESMEDGNPIDAVFFGALIAAGAAVLIHRRVAVSGFLRNNVWLTLFLVYCFLSIMWSDFPFVAFKRWTKVLGHPIMAMVILTEKNPVEGVRHVLKRSAYFLIPFSVLVIKYYPYIGRYFDTYTGQAFNRGIQLNKNELGYVCMVFGIFFAWNLLSTRRLERADTRREETVLSIAFLGMIWWLLAKAGSATSLACGVIGIVIMLAVGIRGVSRRVGTWMIVALVILAGAELGWGVHARVVDLLGRDPTLTDRTEVWEDLLAMDINPVLGTGFESFWLGPRLDKLWSKWWWKPIQAHNGYIETYLNLGWVGLLILMGLLFATFRKSRRTLLDNLDWGRFRLGVLFTILAYNYTEASFKGVSLVWTLFHIITIDYPTGTGELSAAPFVGNSIVGNSVVGHSVVGNSVVRRAGPARTSSRREGKVVEPMSRGTGGLAGAHPGSGSAKRSTPGRSSC